MIRRYAYTEHVSHLMGNHILLSTALAERYHKDWPFRVCTLLRGGHDLGDDAELERLNDGINTGTAR
jgi:hypothetical protein